MSFTVTEDPTKSKLSLKDPWVATREFIVTSDTFETDANAIQATGVPQANDQYYEGSPLICQGPEIVEKPGPMYWRIVCQYAIPKSGSFGSGGTPLLEPMTIQWNQGMRMVPSDRDIDKRPVMNAAGDLVEFNNDYLEWGFDIYRNEPFFDFNKAKEYSNTVNLTAVTLGNVTFAAGRLCCELIFPSAPYVENPQYVRMKYCFRALLTDDLGDNPWQTRIVNTGRQGWGSDGTGNFKGPFVNVGGERIDEVFLALDGSPLAINGVVKVLGPSGAVAAIPNPNTVTPFATEQFPASGTPTCTFLTYIRKRRIDLNALF